MKLYKNGLRGKRSRSKTTPTLIGLLLLTLFFAVTLASSAGAAATGVPLGTADGFAVLAGSGITNTGATTVNGDIGTFPTTTITGIGTMTVNGTNHAGDGVTQQAKTDLVTAYNTAAGEGPTSPIVADLGGQTLMAGVYNSASSIGLTGALTLDAAGNPGAVFVFQAGSSLTTASASHINLINGAQACNVFWQIGSSATLGTGSGFVGTILASASITVTTGVTVNGRVLARDGAVTLDNDTIVRATCAPAAPAPAPAPTRRPPRRRPPRRRRLRRRRPRPSPRPRRRSSHRPRPSRRRSRPFRLRVRPSKPSASPVDQGLGDPRHARARRIDRDGRGVGGSRGRRRAPDPAARRGTPAARGSLGARRPNRAGRSRSGDDANHRRTHRASRPRGEAEMARGSAPRTAERTHGVDPQKRDGPIHHPLAHRREHREPDGDGLPGRSTRSGIRRSRRQALDADADRGVLRRGGD